MPHNREAWTREKRPFSGFIKAREGHRERERTKKQGLEHENQKRVKRVKRTEKINRKEEDDRTRKAKTEERKQCWWNSPSTPPSSFASSRFQEQMKKEKRERDRERENRQTRNKEGEDIVRPELTGRHLRLHLYPTAAPGKLSVSLLFCICILIH